MAILSLKANMYISYIFYNENYQIKVILIKLLFSLVLDYPSVPLNNLNKNIKNVQDLQLYLALKSGFILDIFQKGGSTTFVQRTNAECLHFLKASLHSVFILGKNQSTLGQHFVIF